MTVGLKVQISKILALERILHHRILCLLQRYGDTQREFYLWEGKNGKSANPLVHTDNVPGPIPGLGAMSMDNTNIQVC